MISHFFIDRPIFASVLSIVLVLGGIVAWRTLPVEQYPNVTPPTVQVTALYPGANALTVRDTVAAPDPGGDNDGADVAGDPETGGTCTSSLTTCFDGTGGLDQNVYSAPISP